LQQIAPHLAAKRSAFSSAKKKAGVFHYTRKKVYSCILYVGFLGAVNGKDGYA